MTMTIERPIVDDLFINHDDWDLKTLFEPIIQRLIRLDYAEWRTQFAIDGFTDAQVETLETMVQEWINTGKDSLAEQLTAVQSIEDDEERERVVDRWLDSLSRSAIANPIRRAAYPMPLDAICYAVGQLGRVINASVEFEVMRRELLNQPNENWSMTPEQIAEGVSLAELGLAEDAKAWPHY